VRTDPRTGRVYAIDAYPVPAKDGRPELAIELLRDITEAKQIEAQLRNQEKLAALGVLAAGIAHDIANPLASMSSELELLLAEEDVGRARQSAAVLLAQISRIGRTLREMTDFARRRAEELSDAAIEISVDDALRMVRHDPRARAIAFKTELAPHLPRVQVVDDHLTMVLVNLLINSLDAMPDGGTITINARACGDYVRLSVTDTGAGMSEAVMRRAVEPLYTTKPGRGTGLGLSISAGILRDAGGTLDIDSTEGVGTTVHLTCPAVRARRLAHA
jgi:two-component system sensor histidine kinase HydH